MKATEMREMAKVAAMDEVSKISELIREESEQGNTELKVHPLCGGTIAFLRDMGFEVEINSYNIAHDRTLNTFIIRWA